MITARMHEPTGSDRRDWPLRKPYCVVSIDLSTTVCPCAPELTIAGILGQLYGICCATMA